MKQVYQTPDFDVSAYELDDIITISIGDSGWVEIWRSRSNRSDLLTIISRARFALLCFFVPCFIFCALFCLCTLFWYLYAYSVFVLNLGAVCLFFFCVSYEELSTHPCPPFSLFVFHFRFRLFTFQPPLQRASLAKAVWKLFASLVKGGGLPKASRRDSIGIYRI